MIKLNLFENTLKDFILKHNNKEMSKDDLLTTLQEMQKDNYFGDVKFRKIWDAIEKLKKNNIIEIKE